MHQQQLCVCVCVCVCVCAHGAMNHVRLPTRKKRGREREQGEKRTDQGTQVQSGCFQCNFGSSSSALPLLSHSHTLHTVILEMLLEIFQGVEKGIQQPSYLCYSTCGDVRLENIGEVRCCEKMSDYRQTPFGAIIQVQA